MRLKTLWQGIVAGPKKRKQNEYEKISRSEITDVLENAKAQQELVVKQVNDKEKQFDKFNDGIDKLVDKLDVMNEHFKGSSDLLSRNNQLYAQLLVKVDQLPQAIQDIQSGREQREMFEAVIDQMHSFSRDNQKFVQVVEKLGPEAARQTNELMEISRYLQDNVDNGGRMLENFAKLNDSLEALNGNSVSQIQSTDRMNRSIAVSTRHQKLMQFKLHKQSAWMFYTVVGFSIFSLSILGTMVYMLLRKLG